MSTIHKTVIGETTEALLKLVFDHRVIQESTEEALNTYSRAIQIRDLKSQLLAFIKRNPNADFQITIPERLIDKNVVLLFSNYTESDEDEEFAQYHINIDENFVKATITQKVKIGKDIVLKIKASER